MHTTPSTAPKALQTSARHIATQAPADADLFGDPADVTSEEPAADCLAFTGTVARQADVRVRPIGADEHMVPVVCIDLVDVGPSGHSLHAEQVFTNATRAQADQLAARLKCGVRITLTTPLTGMRLVLPHVRRVDVLASSH